MTNQNNDESLVEKRLAKIESDMRYLRDLEDVRKNLALYCHAVDNKDADLLGRIFSSNMELSVSPWSFEYSGLDKVLEFYINSFPDSDQVRHTYSNEIIEECENGYKSTCYFNSAVAIGSESLFGWGTYNDKFIFENGILKYSKKSINVIVLAPIDKGWAGANNIKPVHSKE